jgi:hypothetical protein
MGKSTRAEAGRITCPPVGGGATAGGTGTDDGNPTKARGGMKPDRDWGRVPCMAGLGTSRRADTGRMGGADPDGRMGMALKLAMLATPKKKKRHQRGNATIEGAVENDKNAEIQKKYHH